MSLTPYLFPGLKTQEDIICEVFQINRTDLFKKSRKREITEARHFYFWYTKIKNKLKVCQIVRLTKADHCSVLYGIKTTKNLMETNADFRYKAMKAIKALHQLNKLKTPELNNSGAN